VSEGTGPAPSGLSPNGSGGSGGANGLAGIHGANGAVGRLPTPAAGGGPGSDVANGPWVIVVHRVVKTYVVGMVEVHALRGVSLAIQQGDWVAIMGASGSGKTTLMNIIGCLDVPTSGHYLLDGIDVSSLDDRELAEVRNSKIGFVFQSFNLLARTTALQNVELPLAYAGLKGRARRRLALAALDAVGLANRTSHVPSELSGGQQQRVAVARAIATNPALILADEPTGNLDTVSTNDVLSLFGRLNTEGRTVVMITHEHDVAEHAKRVIRLRDGEVIDDHRQAPVAGPPPKYRVLTGTELEPGPTPTPNGQWPAGSRP
jgi:putative ABC transport system ATP-binding protein